MVKENFVNPEYEVYMTSLVNESVLSKYDGASGFKMERTALLTRRLREFIFLLSKGESVIWKINKNVDYIKSVISDNIGYLYFNTYEWNIKDKNNVATRKSYYWQFFIVFIFTIIFTSIIT